MNKFELFTVIYYWLDNYYKDTADDLIINQLSDMNPFIWAEATSADPAVYDEYCTFIKEKDITLENSLAVAKEYAASIEYADISEAFENVDKNEWEKGIRKYLENEHKGADISE